MGGGGSAGIVALAQKLLGSEWIAPALLAYLGLTYGVARTAYSLSTRRRERRLAQLLEELVASIRSVAQPPRQPLGADGDTRGPRLLR